MLPKGGMIWLLMLLLLGLSLAAADLPSRFHLKRDRPLSIASRRLSEDLSASTTGAAAAAATPRRESSFDPDVLNRFLEEYANKIKRTTERPGIPYNEDDTRIPQDSQDLEVVAIETADRDTNATSTPQGFREPARLNDTIKRHKFYGANPQSIEDRNNGWVTLEAIPWSKSKISKWQANPTTQGPWPDSKPWDKPGFNNKPWNSELPARPASYESNRPWQNKLTKPHWSDSSTSGSSKPWYGERPRPIQEDRPSYGTVDKYEDNPNQAQKWPPERPSWDRYGDQSRPLSGDIITDNAPPNFPSWDRPGQRPSYTHHMESYVNEPSGWNDRNDFPSNGKYRPADDGGGDGVGGSYYDRPHFSQYQYPSSSVAAGGAGGLGNLPPSHPSSGDGQWVLLSTNRGYSKSRQRSIKLDALVNTETTGRHSAKKQPALPAPGEEDNVPAVTSKRQIRLTVLPSINGTNTTTSHGGMLEVERTFKTVEQSQKEYERDKKGNGTQAGRPLATRIFINKRPIRNTLAGAPVSNSAVLAAVGAGMLPATMAMMIPMMLGKRRRRRSVANDRQPILPLHLPLGTLVAQAAQLRQRRI